MNAHNSIKRIYLGHFPAEATIQERPLLARVRYVTTSCLYPINFACIRPLKNVLTRMVNAKSVIQIIYRL